MPHHLPLESKILHTESPCKSSRLIPQVHQQCHLHHEIRLTHLQEVMQTAIMWPVSVVLQEPDLFVYCASPTQDAFLCELLPPSNGHLQMNMKSLCHSLDRKVNSSMLRSAY